MAKQQKPWGYCPRNATTSQLQETLKREVTTKANELIETVLKAKHIQPPPENPLITAFIWRLCSILDSGWSFIPAYHEMNVWRLFGMILSFSRNEIIKQGTY